MGEPKKQIAVLGGGLGALSTVFELTSQPGWQDSYDVTVYQMGWRLGGKGASGRNQDHGERIQEHGLHVWLGCYHNAFDMIQRCYRECREQKLTPGSPFQDWTDAFQPSDLVTIMDQFQNAWLPWTTTFPRRRDEPGTGGLWPEPWDYLIGLLDFLIEQFESAVHPLVQAFVDDHQKSQPKSWLREVIDSARQRFEAVLDEVDRPATRLHLVRRLIGWMSADPSEATAGQLQAVMTLGDQFREYFFQTIAREIEGSLVLHRLWILLDLGWSMSRGMVRDGVLHSGLDVLDRYDFQEWLRDNGATAANAWSAPVRAVYDLVFAYEQGDSTRPNLAAGVAMRIILRVTLGYRGAIVYRMKAGMGDTIFTPLYKVLQHRGVKFHFFHRIDQLHLSPDGKYIDSIDLGIQAELTAEAKRSNRAAEYAPLTSPIHGLECWPDRPNYGQLVRGDEMKEGAYDLESAWTTWTDAGAKTLRRGVDFDLVLLGISQGALPYLTAELGRVNGAWQAMLDRIKTVQTQGIQVWGNHNSQAMGWDQAQPNIWAAYDWAGADMSHLIPLEAWPADLNVSNISYYCKQLPDAAVIPPPGPNDQFPQQQSKYVAANGVEFLSTEIAPIWPKAVAPADPQSINWNWVIDSTNQAGPLRFQDQYWRANINPTERYVMSVKGSTQYRLTSETCGFLNLYLAGDWTLNGFNAGCVEATATSGLMACRAICGSPQVIFGASDLHRESVSHGD